MALHRRLAGVDTVSISLSRQTVAVEFADRRAPFSPAAFRAAASEAGVDILSFQIEACGVIESTESGRSLIAGENRCILGDAAIAPVAELVCISGGLDDRTEPYRLAITAVQPASR